MKLVSLRKKDMVNSIGHYTGERGSPNLRSRKKEEQTPTYRSFFGY